MNHFLTSAEYAELLGIPKNAAAQQRLKGEGPVFVKVGRRVRYRRADVERWIEENLMASTRRPAGREVRA